MKSYKFLLLIFLLCQFSNQLEGQLGYFEVGAGIGISNYSGDMSTDNVAEAFRTAKASAMVYSRYNFNPWISAKGGLSYVQYAADDANSKLRAIPERNLSFHSNLWELALTGEFNFWRYDPVNENSVFVLYATGGVAGFYFDPLTEYEGRNYRLQPLGTEGQGLAEYPERDFYSLYQIAFPVGGGAKIKINESLNLNIEVSFRITFTDYLDDLSTFYPDYNLLLAERGEVAANLSHRYSDQDPGSRNDQQRGNAAVDDYYYSFHVGLSYNLVNSFTPGTTRRKRRKSITSKCPTF